MITIIIILHPETRKEMMGQQQGCQEECAREHKISTIALISRMPHEAYFMIRIARLHWLVVVALVSRREPGEQAKAKKARFASSLYWTSSRARY